MNSDASGTGAMLLRRVLWVEVKLEQNCEGSRLVRAAESIPERVLTWSTHLCRPGTTGGTHWGITVGRARAE